MNRTFTTLQLLLIILIGSSTAMGQQKKTQKEFRPVSIMDNIDKPEGMAVIGHTLYISQYHEKGSIVKYDLANKVVSGKVIEGLNYPTGLLAFKNELVVLEFGTGSLYMVNPESGEKKLMATGFSRPVDIISFKDQLLVSDFGRGMIYAVNPETFERTIFAKGLSSPAGMAVYKDQVHVVEWGMHRVSRVNTDGTKEILVAKGLSSPWGLMVYDNEMYVAENGSNQISGISEVKIPIEEADKEVLKDRINPFQDSISVWKVRTMDCPELHHPEAFCVSARGIFVSEWKSKQVSEIILNSPPSGQLLLTGKAKLGNNLLAEAQNIQDEDGLGPFTYRWQISNRPDADVWTDLEGNEVEYALKNTSLVGRYIRAALNYTDQGGLKEQVYSEAKPVINTFAPQVALSFYPEGVLLPGDTVTITAEISVLDEDAVQDKVEFYSNGTPLKTLSSPPYRYSFVVQDNQTEEGYIDNLSISVKGYDSNGLFGEDERTIFVTNDKDLESNLSALLNSPEAISIYPNPVENTLNIVHKYEEPTTIRIIDLNGKVVMSTIMSNGFKALDVSGLLSGAYIVEHTAGNETRAQKIIKP